MGIHYLVVSPMSKQIEQLLSKSTASESETNAPLRIAEMHDEDVVQIFKALSGESTCRIYREIQRSPKTASELQQVLDTSIQNVHYHLDKLEEAGLIEPVDARYSEKGAEMSVFGPTHSPLIISFASESTNLDVRAALTRLFSGVTVLGLASVGVELLAKRASSPETSGSDAGGNVSMTAPQFADTTPLETLLLSPGLLLFITGLLIISVYVTWQYAKLQQR
jgi:DNA-binding transcriptional ArsR family regulator